MNEYWQTLGELVLERIDGKPFEIAGVSADSRKIGPDWIFIAVSGSKRDGNAFIADAVRQGAKWVVTAHKPGEWPYQDVSLAIVSDAYAAHSRLLSCFHHFPERNLTLLGVTGTNGKTTSAYLLRGLLARLGVRSGLISTVEYDDGQTIEPADRTTPGPELLFELFDRMRANGVGMVPMELSSHALSQNRTATAEFQLAIFTNLTGDHLDYHLDMENYYLAKKKLFADLLAADGVAVVNLDDHYGERLFRELGNRRKIGFGRLEGADLPLEILELSDQGGAFLLGQTKFTTDLLGEHNIYNLAGVLAGLIGLGFPPATLKKLTGNIAVPGRLQRFVMPNGAQVFVDYAHTDDALAHVLSTMRSVARGRVIVLLGCGGDRDRSKRPRMGKAASRLADLSIVTSDNPRNEEPMAIIGQILAGMEPGKPFLVEVDRKRAIKLALSQAAAKDLVLIAGKGHEDYQEFAKGARVPFDDRLIVQEFGGKER